MDHILSQLYVFEGRIARPPVFTPRSGAKAATGGSHLRVRTEYASQLWPWTGYLAVFITYARSALLLLPDPQSDGHGCPFYLFKVDFFYAIPHVAIVCPRVAMKGGRLGRWVYRGG